MGKWYPQEGQKIRKNTKLLPSQEQNKVTGNASLAYGSFAGKIYNGSNWIITEMVIRVVAKEGEGVVR